MKYKVWGKKWALTRADTPSGWGDEGSTTGGTSGPGGAWVISQQRHMLEKICTHFQRGQSVGKRMSPYSGRTSLRVRRWSLNNVRHRAPAQCLCHISAPPLARKKMFTFSESPKCGEKNEPLLGWVLSQGWEMRVQQRCRAQCLCHISVPPLARKKLFTFSERSKRGEKNEP